MSDKIPTCNQDDPGELAAWYGSFGFFDHLRKPMLAHCRLAIRGEYALKSEKVTEAMLDDQSHTHPLYLQFLTQHLTGRIKYERMIREKMGV